MVSRAQFKDEHMIHAAAPPAVDVDADEEQVQAEQDEAAKEPDDSAAVCTRQIVACVRQRKYNTNT